MVSGPSRAVSSELQDESKVQLEKKAKNGKGAKTFATEEAPNGVAFDGVHIWVANQGSYTVTKLRASDGALAWRFLAASAWTLIKRLALFCLATFRRLLKET